MHFKQAYFNSSQIIQTLLALKLNKCGGNVIKRERLEVNTSLALGLVFLVLLLQQIQIVCYDHRRIVSVNLKIILEATQFQHSYW